MENILKIKKLVPQATDNVDKLAQAIDLEKLLNAMCNALTSDKEAFIMQANLIIQLYGTK
jgi:ubiquinone biosynthesis protein Coq4